MDHYPTPGLTVKERQLWAEVAARRHGYTPSQTHLLLKIAFWAGQEGKGIR